MPEKKIQEYLFQQIKETLPAGESFVDAIAEVHNTLRSGTQVTLVQE